MQKAINVVLVGNPNTGKSTLFTALSGINQRTGNFPGVTVEMKKGQFKIADQTVELVDLPGTYSLAPRSPDEMVSVDLLLGRLKNEPQPDLILSVVDASNLERHLYLTTQLIAIGKPIILAVNMVDLADKNGITIDAQKLSQQLGLPVVLLTANQNTGVEELKKAILANVGNINQPLKAVGPKLPHAFDDEVAKLQIFLANNYPKFIIERLLLDVKGATEEVLIRQHGSQLADKLAIARQNLTDAELKIPIFESKARYQWIRTALQGAIQKPAYQPASQSDKIDYYLTHRIWGTLFFLIVMAAIFQIMFYCNEPFKIAIEWAQAKLVGLVEAKMSMGPLRSLIANGLILGVGSVVIFLPQIIILFGVIAILEDCGYMARAAYLMDRLMSKCGLSGKSFIPLLSSVACAVPGIMATRVIENRRDRFATMVVAPLMSCSARLPVYGLLIGAFLTVNRPFWLPGLVMFALYMIGFVVAPLVALILKKSLLRGATPIFVMELPAYKWPAWKVVLRRMWDAGWAFLKRAGTLIFASMILIWAANYFPTTALDGSSYPQRHQAAKEKVEAAGEGDDEQSKLAKDAAETEMRAIKREWQENSYLGRLGRTIAPITEPLGWDWKITTATLASFPAREVIVGTMGMIYEKDEEDHKNIGQAIADDWHADPRRSKYAVPIACSVLVFFALCCQCVSTLAVIRRETKTWRWPIFTFVYMTTLAYVAAFVTYQIGKLIVG